MLPPIAQQEKRINIERIQKNSENQKKPPNCFGGFDFFTSKIYTSAVLTVLIMRAATL